MPTIHFMGYVEPRETKFNVEGLDPITERDIRTGRDVTYTVAILDSVVSVECELDEFRIEEISQIYTRAVELSRTVVNLISVKMGWGLVVHINRLFHPDPEGKEELLMNQAEILTGSIDTYGLHEINEVFQAVACDVDFCMALNDMNDALSRPRTTAVSCARIIDAVRHLLAPNEKVMGGWRMVQEMLNADQEYLELISMQSRSSRHGKHEFVSREESEELLRRTWEIVNRYLFHRLHAKAKLPVDRFPQLKNVPKPQP